jgi:hypothetical protein
MRDYVATSKVHSLIVEKRDLVVNSASKSCLIIMHWRMAATHRRSLEGYFLY